MIRELTDNGLKLQTREACAREREREREREGNTTGAASRFAHPGCLCLTASNSNKLLQSIDPRPKLPKKKRSCAASIAGVQA